MQKILKQGQVGQGYKRFPRHILPYINYCRSKIAYKEDCLDCPQQNYLYTGGE
jgi:hypothetical protein